MTWSRYVLDLLAGALLANGVPHFVQGISGNPFQSPFARPPGIGESSAQVNVAWGFANFMAGGLLLHFFWPMGPGGAIGWSVVALGGFLLAMQMASHFGKVRTKKV